ncbi:MAG: deoxyhypusine synthase family protein [Candidatus Omnitrophota bacterium]
MPRNKKTAKRALKDGFKDGLVPIQALELSSVNTVNDMVKGMARASFGARSVGDAADVLYKMTKDKGCFVVATVSGAMTVAKMGLVLCDMIDSGMVNAVVSTGAVITHGFVESIGKAHFKIDPEADDSALYDSGYDRVYDTVELEKNFDDISVIVNKVLSSMDRGTVLSSVALCGALGRYLAGKYRTRNILKCAYQKKIPVYIPAFTDSELGLDVAIFNRAASAGGGRKFAYDPFLDLEHFASLIEKQTRLGIFTVGGGVPRNWAQQVCPYLELVSSRLGVKTRIKKYLYGVRICPEPVHWGGLSGCTYREGISWGKFTPPSEGGRWAEVYADATIAWPLIVKAVMERV